MTPIYIGEELEYEELFDHVVDPHNTRNLADVSKYRRTLVPLCTGWRVWRVQLAAWRPDAAWHDPAPQR